MAAPKLILIIFLTFLITIVTVKVLIALTVWEEKVEPDENQPPPDHYCYSPSQCY